MKPVELKIYNQTLKVNVNGDTMDFYESVAARLNELMMREEKKSNFLPDIRVAVRVAFMLALENEKLKESIDKSDKVINRIASNLKLEI